jgi:hypothetical protein
MPMFLNICRSLLKTLLQHGANLFNISARTVVTSTLHLSKNQKIQNDQKEVKLMLYRWLYINLETYIGNVW